MEFLNRVVVITGAAGVLGGVITEKFYQQGASLVLVDKDRKGLENLAAKLNLDEARCILVEADVRDENQVKQYVLKAVTHFGGIDVFINHAGILGSMAPVTQLSVEDINEVLQVNCIGVFLGLKYVIPVMQKQKRGVILNSASVLGFITAPCMTPYVMSKHAILGITKTAALEYANFGIRVNAICPGPIESPLLRQMERGIAPNDPELAKEQLKSMIAFGDYGTAEDVAELVLFLSSDRAKYITGNSYTLDGGFTLRN